MSMRKAQADLELQKDTPGQRTWDRGRGAGDLGWGQGSDYNPETRFMSFLRFYVPKKRE